MLKKLSLLLLAAIGVGLFFFYDLNQLLTLDGLKGSMAQFDQYKAQSPLLVIGGFFLLYILVTALSLPGAAILTLAAGALFGLAQGLLVASFASSIGATLAFFVCTFIAILFAKPELLEASDAAIASVKTLLPSYDEILEIVVLAAVGIKGLKSIRR